MKKVLFDNNLLKKNRNFDCEQIFDKEIQKIDSLFNSKINSIKSKLDTLDLTKLEYNWNTSIDIIHQKLIL
jgi:hypothetical protein